MFKENQNDGEETKTIIGASVNVEGDFKGKGDVIVEGKLKGSIKTNQNLDIGSKAIVNAQIEAANAYVAGSVTGNIIVKEKLELTKTARIKGNIQAKQLSIETGAVFNGQASMGQEDSAELDKKADK